MSSDLSSSHSVPISQRSWGKAVLITIGVILLFLSGQIYGAIVGSVLIGAYRSILGTELSMENITIAEQALLSLFGSLAVGALLFLVLKFMRKNSLKFLGLKPFPQWTSIFAVTSLLFFAYIGTSIVVALIAASILPAYDPNQQQNLGFENPVGVEYALVFISLVVLPPIIEELVFRGFLYTQLKKYAGILFAVVVTSIVFGAAHLEFFGESPLHYAAALDTAVFSVYLIAAYEKTKSIWSSIGMHAAKNLIAFTAIYIFTIPGV